MNIHVEFTGLLCHKIMNEGVFTHLMLLKQVVPFSILLAIKLVPKFISLLFLDSFGIIFSQKCWVLDFLEIVWLTILALVTKSWCAFQKNSYMYISAYFTHNGSRWSAQIKIVICHGWSEICIPWLQFAWNWFACCTRGKSIATYRFAFHILCFFLAKFSTCCYF